MWVVCSDKEAYGPFHSYEDALHWLIYEHDGSGYAKWSILSLESPQSGSEFFAYCSHVMVQARG